MEGVAAAGTGLPVWKSYCRAWAEGQPIMKARRKSCAHPTRKAPNLIERTWVKGEAPAAMTATEAHAGLPRASAAAASCEKKLGWQQKEEEETRRVCVCV